MTIWTLALMAIALSADAFAVSVSNGMSNSKIIKKHCIITALTFGGFQAIMPTIGYFAGLSFSSVISSFDHYVAFALLGIIGAKMIVESVKKDDAEEYAQKKFSYKALMIQGIATSIDALAVGVTLSVVNINIIFSSALIGIITFAICLFGILMGKKLGLIMGKRAELIGGIILILIGTNILIESFI